MCEPAFSRTVDLLKRPEIGSSTLYQPDLSKGSEKDCPHNTRTVHLWGGPSGILSVTGIGGKKPPASG
jgi:hypothetical protein